MQPFADADQALEYSNDVSYGLASSVWTNSHIPLVGEMPHGGFKDSGYGKDLSMFGFEEYTRIKHVMSAH